MKNFGEQGWGFYNLQSSETTMASGTKLTPAATGIEDDDSFTQVLSEVVNTPDLKIKENVPEPIPVFVPDVKPAEPIVTPSMVARLSENTNDQGREFTYLIDGDTVSIFIPAAATITQSIPTNVDTVSVKAIPPAEESLAAAQSQSVKDNLAAADTRIENDSKPVTIVPEKKETPKPSGVTMVNSDCKADASEEDFMKLRKKMASEKNEVKMVVVARKAFKSKCYSTSQIKNLGVLFLNDSGRFQFFESAYPFVLDSNNFTGLQSELTDPYYITRFKSLTRR